MARRWFVCFASLLRHSRRMARTMCVFRPPSTPLPRSLVATSRAGNAQKDGPRNRRKQWRRARAVRDAQRKNAICRLYLVRVLQSAGVYSGGGDWGGRGVDGRVAVAAGVGGWGGGRGLCFSSLHSGAHCLIIRLQARRTQTRTWGRKKKCLFL